MIKINGESAARWCSRTKPSAMSAAVSREPRSASATPAPIRSPPRPGRRSRGRRGGGHRREFPGDGRCSRPPAAGCCWPARPGRSAARFAVGHGPGFAVGREGPGPSGPVVVGRLAAGVLIAGVLPPVGSVRVVEQGVVEADRQRMGDGPVRQAADGAGDQKLLAGGQDHPGVFQRCDGPQRDGEDLVRAKVVVGGGGAGGCPASACRQSDKQPGSGRQNRLHEGFAHAIGQRRPAPALLAVDAAQKTSARARGPEFRPGSPDAGLPPESSCPSR
jgi:hypothetical protein